MKERISNKKRTRGIGSTYGAIEIFFVDVTICTSNRQLSLSLLESRDFSLFLLASLLFPSHPSFSLSLYASLCWHGPCNCTEAGAQCARDACERGMHHACVCRRRRWDRKHEWERERGWGREESGSFTSRARSRIQALCYAKNCWRRLDARASERDGDASRVFKRR